MDGASESLTLRHIRETRTLLRVFLWLKYLAVFQFVIKQRDSMLKGILCFDKQC